MLIKNLKGLLAVATLSLVAGCSTPCAPGGLCAPGQANTSASPVASPAPAFPGTQPAAPAVQTSPVEAPPPARQDSAPVTRIGLLLPLSSPILGQAAEAVRAGFMAGYERDRTGFAVNVVPTGDAPQEALDAYTRAVASNDIVVGPLARSAVAAIAAGAAITKPTVALNDPQLGRALPPQMLVIGLSIEDEARQVADWAAAEHPNGRAWVLTGTSAWQRRTADAFAARWRQLGYNSTVIEIPVIDGYVDGNFLADLRARLDSDAPDLMFAALDASALRQVRSSLGTSLPTYGASSVNPGLAPDQVAPELNGVRVLDLPWQVQPHHPAVMVYPRPLGAQSLDMERLYALGIDAFRVVREIAQQPGRPFELDGVTGKLRVEAAPSGNGGPTFRRTESQVIYQDGSFQPFQPGY